MKKPMKLSVGDVVTTKKNHPCGSNEFTLTRVGMDIRMKCHISWDLGSASSAD